MKRYELGFNFDEWGMNGSLGLTPKENGNLVRYVDVLVLKQRLSAAEALLQEINECPTNWEQCTIPAGGMDVSNIEHRRQVVGTQHISYDRTYRIADFLRKG